MGINVIGITNLLALTDDGRYADKIHNTDLRAHQLLVGTLGRGAAFVGAADKARELGASRVLLGGFRDAATSEVVAEENPVRARVR